MPDSSAPTLPAKGSRNLMLRIAAAALLAPVALMFVFAGGWLWVLLVTAIAVGLFYEWHEIVNPGRNPRTFAAGVIALELIGLALWFGWGGVAWAAFILRADVHAVRGLGERHRRLFRGPRHRRPEAVAARQPEQDMGGLRRRIGSERAGGPYCELARLGAARAAAHSCARDVGGGAVGRSVRVRGEAPFRGQGFEPDHSGPWRPAGPARWFRRRDCFRGSDWAFAGRCRWHRPWVHDLVIR